MLSSVVLAGCGGAKLPPAAAPSPPTARGVHLDTRARTLSAGGRRVPAGVGPTSFAVTDERIYVTDQAQDALLVFDLRPRLHLQRRVYVAGGPRRVSVRGDRLEVSVAHGSVELTADGAARFLRRTR